MAASKAARETVGLLTAEEASELAELTAEEAEMPRPPTPTNDPLAERRKEVAARRKELEEKTPAARGVLDGELADAVKAGDQAAAQAAFAKGAALDLYYVEGMREDNDDRFPGDAAWLTADDLSAYRTRTVSAESGGRRRWTTTARAP